MFILIARFKGGLLKVGHSSKVRSFAAVLSANVINNAVAFCIMLHAARRFGVYDFGSFALAVSTTVVLALVFDAGLSVALVRLYSRPTSPDRTLLPKSIFLFKAYLLVISAVALFPVRHTLNGLLLPGRNVGVLIYMAVMSAGLLSLWSSLRALEQARGNFRRFSNYTCAYAILRISCYSVFALSGKLDVTTGFACLYAIPLGCLLSIELIGGIKHPRNLFAGVLELKALGGAVRYGSWVAVSGILYMLVSRIPQFVLARTKQGAELGIYGAALTFTAGFSLLNDSLRTIILPDVVSRTTIHDRLRFRNAHKRSAPLYVAVIIACLGLATIVQYAFLGPKYRAAIPVFLVIGTAMAATMFIGFANTLVHSVGIPRLETAMNAVRLLAIVVLALIVPQNALAAGTAYSIVLIGGEVALFIAVKAYEGAADASERAAVHPAAYDQVHAAASHEA